MRAVQAHQRRHLRVHATWVFLCALVLVGLRGSGDAHAATRYRVTGHGWGHGIGMSQYGAQGFAQHGYTAGQIIRYYFQGVTLGPVPRAARVVDVQLVSGRSTALFRIDGAGARVRAGTSTFRLLPGDRVEVRAAGGSTTVLRRRGDVSEQLVAGATTTTSLKGRPGAIATMFTGENGAYGAHYRGRLRVHMTGGSLSVINRVALDDYLRGVVPAEMPASWKQQALRAQAIAARSYAVATRSTSGIFDMHSDTRSQMYLGIEHEDPHTDAAVAATRGRVARFGGDVIPAFFFSTSGGRTASIEDVWGSEPRPYLKSVPDPYEVSPYSDWPTPATYSAAELASALGVTVPGTLQRVRVVLNGSRRARRVELVGSEGTESVSGTSVQVRLGLRSTYFRITPVSG